MSDAVAPETIASDVVVLGPPSVLAVWVFDLLREASILAPERGAIRIIDREDEAEPPGDRPPRLYLSHYPSASLRDAWRRQDAPILLCLDDPADSVRFLHKASGGSLIDALRAHTAAAASYAELRGHPRLLILHRLAEATAAEIIETILRHLDLDLRAEQREALLAGLLPEHEPEAALESALKARVAGYAPLGDSGLSAKDVAMIGGVLAPLLQMSFREAVGPVIWPVETFLSGDKPDTPAPPVADLTGGARILYYGPYFHLPPGSWKVRMMVGFSVDARSMPFSVEVYAADRQLALATMKAEGHGVYHASFSFVHDTPLQPVEVRVRSDEGAIEGRLALGNMEFTREPAVPSADGRG